MKRDRKWLQEIRQKLGKTQQEISEEACIGRAYYTMIENGTRSPSPGVAKRISEVLDFDWTIFFDEKGSEKEHSCIRKVDREVS